MGDLGVGELLRDGLECEGPQEMMWLNVVARSTEKIAAEGLGMLGDSHFLKLSYESLGYVALHDYIQLISVIVLIETPGQ